MCTLVCLLTCALPLACLCLPAVCLLLPAHHASTEVAGEPVEAAKPAESESQILIGHLASYEASYQAACPAQMLAWPVQLPAGPVIRVAVQQCMAPGQSAFAPRRAQRMAPGRVQCARQRGPASCAARTACSSLCRPPVACLPCCQPQATVLSAPRHGAHPTCILRPPSLPLTHLLSAGHGPGAGGVHQRLQV